MTLTRGQPVLIDGAVGRIVGEVYYVGTPGRILPLLAPALGVHLPEVAAVLSAMGVDQIAMLVYRAGSDLVHLTAVHIPGEGCETL